MTTQTNTLPHQTDTLFLTDGGLETTLVFLEGFDLPHFAAFHLLKDDNGYKAIQDYYRRYLNIAKKHNTGFILESPTWRANPDWIAKIGYPSSHVKDINIKAVQLLVALKKEFEKTVQPILISGCIGPRGDGYRAETKMTATKAEEYHASQIQAFKEMGVDMISAITMNYVEEAIGIARAAAAVNLPTVISFTVETDGKLPTGMSLKEAIEQVDSKVTTKPIYYMINCAHPSHFNQQLQKGQQESWTKRIKGIRANASCKSHAELDESTELDRGNPQQLGEEHKTIKLSFPHINIFGGCCGTDDAHVLEIAKQVKISH